MKNFIADVLLTVAMILLVSLYMAMGVLNVLCQMESFAGTTRQILVIGLSVTAVTFYGLMRYAIPKIRASWYRRFGQTLRPARKREKLSLKRILEKRRLQKETALRSAQYKEKKNKPRGRDYDIPISQT